MPWGNMTYQEFKNKYDGQGIDFDGAYGDQCVDLAQQYNKEVFNGPFLAGAGAKDIFYSFPTAIYDRVGNGPTNVPQTGDIVIWGTEVGPWGHIAIFDHGDASSFTSFDQNWPVDSKCHLQGHDYFGVLGWLHPKALVVDDCPAKLAEKTALETELRGVIQKKDETISHLGDTINAKNAEIATLQTRISSLDEQVLILTSQVGNAKEQALKMLDLTNRLSECSDSRLEYMAQVSKLQEQITKIKNTLVPKKYLSKKIYDLIMTLE